MQRQTFTLLESVVRRGVDQFSGSERARQAGRLVPKGYRPGGGGRRGRPAICGEFRTD